MNLLNCEGRFVHLAFFGQIDTTAPEQGRFRPCRLIWLRRHIGNEILSLRRACNHFASNVVCSLLIDMDIDLTSRR